jgi:cytochrome P450
MLFANITKKKFNREEIHGEILGFFAAGHESTSNSLTWAALELSRRPEIVKRLRTDIDPIIDSQEDFIQKKKFRSSKNSYRRQFVWKKQH